MAYLRVGLQEAMQTDSPDSQLRQDVLFQLVQEGNQETLRARPQVSTSFGDAGRTSTPLTREALLSAATPARGMPQRQPGMFPVLDWRREARELEGMSGTRSHPAFHNQTPGARVKNRVVRGRWGEDRISMAWMKLGLWIHLS